MSFYKFFLNLDRSPDRRTNFDDTWTRFKATDGYQLPDDDPILKRMVSLWNINPHEHRAKCGCWQTHYNMLCHIVNQRLNKVIVVEDDALQINDIDPDLLVKCKNFTYLAGYFSHKKMYDGPLKHDELPESHPGINRLDKSQCRMIMMVAYYIPHWTIARDIVQYLDGKSRVRALDCQIYDIVKVPLDYIYPAIFVEYDSKSTIHSKSRKKHPNPYYELV